MALGIRTYPDWVGRASVLEGHSEVTEANLGRAARVDGSLETLTPTIYRSGLGSSGDVIDAGGPARRNAGNCAVCCVSRQKLDQTKLQLDRGFLCFSIAIFNRLLRGLTSIPATLERRFGGPLAALRHNTNGPLMSPSFAGGGSSSVAGVSTISYRNSDQPHASDTPGAVDDRAPVVTASTLESSSASRVWIHEAMPR
jgi:hypothetical protein